MNSDDEEHSESEFYYPTEDFTFPVANKNEVLVPESAMESETSLTSPEEFRKKVNILFTGFVGPVRPREIFPYTDLPAGK